MIDINGKTMRYPLIQGGMGVGVSLGNLAGSVAAEGGMGVISTANPGYRKADFWRNPIRCNEEALIEEIAKAKAIVARSIAKGSTMRKKAGLLAINTMVATSEYENMVRTAIKSGVDAIISGAGLPLKLPKYANGSNCLLAPIVSGARSIKTICRHWDSRYQVTPDFVIIETAEAGGHLGFKYEELVEKKYKSPDEILKEVITELDEFRGKYNKKIPIYMAGGVYNYSDLKHYQSLGAEGIQVATRFIATKECDASDTFKEMIVNAKEEDVCIIHSPVGMPGRALNNEFIQRIREQGMEKIKKCVNCLVPCNIVNAPFCITKALIEAVKGNCQEGLIFCGANVGKVDKIVTVKELIHELMYGTVEERK